MFQLVVLALAPYVNVPDAQEQKWATFFVFETPFNSKGWNQRELMRKLKVASTLGAKPIR